MLEVRVERGRSAPVSSNPCSNERDSGSVLLNAAIDQRQVLAGPVDGSANSLAQRDVGLEAQGALGLLGATEALTRAVPIASPSEVDRSGITRQLADQRREVQDRRLHAAGEVVDVARLTRRSAQDEPAHDVVDVDEITGRGPALLHRERQPLER